MADGSSKPIEDVKVGDHIVATDPQTGKTEYHVVLEPLTAQGRKVLVHLKIGAGGNKGSGIGEITATDNHPFWAEDLKTWVPAGRLQPGTWLRTSTGTHVKVVAVQQGVAQRQRVHNLAVEDLHTYYVLAGAIPVLVHNSSSDDDPHTFSNLIPEDTPQYFKPLAPGLVLGRSGNYAYVVTTDGELVIGKRTSGHVNLAQGRDVLAAGEFKTKGGSVVYLDNKSGHYQPYGANAEKAAVSAFNRNGLSADGKYIEAWRPNC